MRFIEEAKKVAKEEADARRKLMLERLRQRPADEEEVSFLVNLAITDGCKDCAGVVTKGKRSGRPTACKGKSAERT
jgi:hypothetical protein